MRNDRNDEDELRLKNQKITSYEIDFNKMRNLFPDRLNVIAEGDSWFAYPRKWFVFGPPANLIDYFSEWLYNTKRKANFYTMASNGDEAVDMISGKQKHDLIEVLKWHTKGKNRRPVDVILFSGGGNDVVGENDFERFLNPYVDGYNEEQCVNMDRLGRKSLQIKLAYQELIDIRDQYSPNTVIFSHTYDYPYPSNDGAEFLGGLIETKSWMKVYMDKSKIPESMQMGIIKIFIDTLAEEILEISNSGVFIVDTRGVLRGKKYWLNEIHPNSEGFRMVAEKMWWEMEKVVELVR